MNIKANKLIIYAALSAMLSLSANQSAKADNATPAPDAGGPPGATNAPASAFKNDEARTSYAIGVSIGTSWKRQGIGVDYDQFVQGLKDSLTGSQLKLTDQEVGETLNKYRQELMAKQHEKFIANKAAGVAFLEANKTKPGVITLTNGLQYKVITEGSGDSPGLSDTALVNYRGTLIDGTEFDSSAKAGKPVPMPVRAVIPGWTQALTMMKPGAKWQLFVPSDLAYGERGRPPQIEPNSTLIFDMELVSVQKAQPPAAPQPLTSDIIKVPSLEEMKKGAKIETIKAEDVEKMQKQAQTNTSAQ